MKRARSQKRSQSTKTKSPPKKKIFKIIGMVVIAILLVITVCIALQPKRWSSEDRFVLLNVTPEDGWEVIVYDKPRKLMTTVNISKETKIEVARQLGEWPLSSVWKLGEQEGRAGELAQFSLMHTYNIPADGWVYNKKFLLNNYQTNLSLKDKLSILLFEAQLGNSDKKNTTMNELSRTPLKLTNLVSSSYFNNQVTTFALFYPNSGTNGSLTDFTDLLENLGGKVVTLQDKTELEVNHCEIRVENKEDKRAIYLSNLLNCNIKNNNKRTNASVELWLGEQFWNIF